MNRRRQCTISAVQFEQLVGQERHSLPYDVVDEELIRTDLDKGMETWRVVIKAPDGCFFEFEYYVTSQHSFAELHYEELVGDEVFPEIITKTIYK